jgi:hypothetical protein
LGKAFAWENSHCHRRFQQPTHRNGVVERFKLDGIDKPNFMVKGEMKCKRKECAGPSPLDGIDGYKHILPAIWEMDIRAW